MRPVRRRGSGRPAPPPADVRGRVRSPADRESSWPPAPAAPAPPDSGPAARAPSPVRRPPARPPGWSGARTRSAAATRSTRPFRRSAWARLKRASREAGSLVTAAVNASMASRSWLPGLENHADAEMRLGQRRGQAGRGAVLGQGAIGVALHVQRRAQVQVRQRIAGFERHGLLQVGHGLGPLPRLDGLRSSCLVGGRVLEQVPQPFENRIGGRQIHLPAQGQVLLGLAAVAQASIRQRQRIVNPRRLGSTRQRRLEVRHRLRVVLARQRQPSEREPHGAALGIERLRLDQERLGLVGLDSAPGASRPTTPAWVRDWAPASAPRQRRPPPVGCRS